MFIVNPHPFRWLASFVVFGYFAGWLLSYGIRVGRTDDIVAGGLFAALAYFALVIGVRWAWRMVKEMLR